MRNLALSTNALIEQLGNHLNPFIIEVLRNNTLNELTLFDKQLNDDDAKVIAAYLQCNPSLKKLSLDSNLIGDEGAIALANALESNTTLTEFHLSDNLVDDKGAGAFADMLKKNQTLTELHLFSNLIKDKGAENIANSLISNSALKELHLNDNLIENQGAEKFLTALLNGSISLSRLSLDSNLFSQEISTRFTEHEKSLKNNYIQISIGISDKKRKAKPLSLDDNHLQFLDRFECFSTDEKEAIKNGTMTLLCLSQQRIKKLNDVDLIIRFLEQNPSINTLDLSDNLLTSQGAGLLSLMLIQNKTLKKINLAKNAIAGNGVKFLIAALEKNNTLLELDISENPIGRVRSKRIAFLLNKNRSLTTLLFRSDRNTIECININLILEKNRCMEYFPVYSLLLCAQQSLNSIFSLLVDDIMNLISSVLFDVCRAELQTSWFWNHPKPKIACDSSLMNFSLFSLSPSLQLKALLLNGAQPNLRNLSFQYTPENGMVISFRIDTCHILNEKFGYFLDRLDETKEVHESMNLKTHDSSYTLTLSEERVKALIHDLIELEQNLLLTP